MMTSIPRTVLRIALLIPYALGHPARRECVVRDVALRSGVWGVGRCAAHVWSCRQVSS